LSFLRRLRRQKTRNRIEADTIKRRLEASTKSEL
jgi:hypothetical protein